MPITSGYSSGVASKQGKWAATHTFDLRLYRHTRPTSFTRLTISLYTTHWGNWDHTVKMSNHSKDIRHRTDMHSFVAFGVGKKIFSPRDRSQFAKPLFSRISVRTACKGTVSVSYQKSFAGYDSCLQMNESVFEMHSPFLIRLQDCILVN